VAFRFDLIGQYLNFLKDHSVWCEVNFKRIDKELPRMLTKDAYFLHEKEKRKKLKSKIETNRVKHEKDLSEALTNFTKQFNWCI